MNPYNNANINVTMISYVIPLYVNHMVLGVVGMDVDLSALDEMVQDVGVYDSGYAFLVDEHANVVYHRALPFGEEMGSINESLYPVAKQLTEGADNDGLFRYDWDGEERQMAVTKLRNGMRLAITAPTREINKARNQLLTQIAVVVAAIAMFFLAVTVVMTHILVRPLKELNVATKKIADGDLTADITHQTGDEIGVLADSFQ